MRKLIYICAFIALLLGLSACRTNININSVRGIGAIVTQDFEVGSFNGISINGPFTITYRQSDTYAVRIEMHENFFTYTTVEDYRGMLRVETTTGFTITRNNSPQIYIYAPYLNTVSLHTATSTRNWDKLYSDMLIMYVSGASSANIEMEVERLELRASGAASFELSGVADELYIDISGAGSINARELQSTNAEVHITGAGSADVYASSTLYASIAGVGSITYYGNPTVTRNVAGIGSVRAGTR